MCSPTRFPLFALRRCLGRHGPRPPAPEQLWRTHFRPGWPPRRCDGLCRHYRTGALLFLLFFFPESFALVSLVVCLLVACLSWCLVSVCLVLVCLVLVCLVLVCLSESMCLCSCVSVGLYLSIVFLYSVCLSVCFFRLLFLSVCGSSVCDTLPVVLIVTPSALPSPLLALVQI